MFQLLCVFASPTEIKVKIHSACMVFLRRIRNCVSHIMTSARNSMIMISIPGYTNSESFVDFLWVSISILQTLISSRIKANAKQSSRKRNFFEIQSSRVDYPHEMDKEVKSWTMAYYLIITDGSLRARQYETKQSCDAKSFLEN
jgi:hypothetical protein